jgi:hypothetical protein
MKALWVPGRLQCGACGFMMRDYPAPFGRHHGDFSCSNPACSEHGIRYQAPVQHVELIKAEGVPK